MNKAAVCLLTLACCLPRLAQAQEATILLLAEYDLGGQAAFWWSCEERPALPVTDRLAPQLENAGLRLIDRCEELASPIHKSYHLASLKAHQVVNLANALGAKRVLSGAMRLSRKEGVPSLGLERVEAQLDLSATDPETGESMGALSLKANGFASTTEDARARALELLLARAIPRLERLVKRASAEGKRRLLIRLEGFDRPGQLDEHVRTLQKRKGIRSATLVEIRKKAGVIAVEPRTAAELALRHLRSAGLQAEVLEKN